MQSNVIQPLHVPPCCNAKAIRQERTLMFTQEFRFTPAVIAKSRMHTLQNARIGLHHWMLEYFSLGLVL